MMPCLFHLAQIAAPSALQFGGWMLCFGSAIWIWNQINVARRGLIGEPPPGERFATKNELAEVRKELKEVGDKMVANYNTILTDASSGRARLHEEINRLAALIHEMKGAIGYMSQHAPQPPKPVSKTPC